MNIIRMSGGLGNQMFQYALLLKFKSMGIEAVMEDFTEYVGRDNARPIKLSVFGIDYPRVDKETYIEFTDSYMDIFSRIRRKITGRKTREYNEILHTFDSKILELDNAYITGFFQSEKYFKDIKAKVLKAFEFTDESLDNAYTLAQELGLYELAKKCKKDAACDLEDNDKSDNSVSVHIRRGDYLNASLEFGNICTDEYYDEAVSYITEHIDNPVFYVFSNDYEYASMWIKKYTDAGIDMKIVKGTTEDNGYLDMCLMSKCEHNIIANSSFSWWGAYLNSNKNKIVIAPSKWVNTCDDVDIYTDEMIRI